MHARSCQILLKLERLYIVLVAEVPDKEWMFRHRGWRVARRKHTQSDTTQGQGDEHVGGAPEAAGPVAAFRREGWRLLKLERRHTHLGIIAMFDLPLCVK